MQIAVCAFVFAQKSFFFSDRKVSQSAAFDCVLSRNDVCFETFQRQVGGIWNSPIYLRGATATGHAHPTQCNVSTMAIMRWPPRLPDEMHAWQTATNSRTENKFNPDPLTATAFRRTSEIGLGPDSGGRFLACDRIKVVFETKKSERLLFFYPYSKHFSNTLLV